MKDDVQRYEKAIEEAATEYTDNGNWEMFAHSDDTRYSSFVTGAKSEAAKEFHQQGMYTELDIAKMIAALGEHDTLSARWLAKWFKTHKKK